MTVIRHAETRRIETGSAVMTTLASPTQGGAGLALWRVEVAAAAAGPVHTIDADQILTVLAGTAIIDLDGTEHTVAEGDTIVLHADRTRRVTGGGAGFTALVAAPAGALARTTEGARPILPPWIA
ncbi:cupin domain-containing protein [Nocardia takedensis]|uniref:cupin domain-containing protein n=1 Tax=Nocardia takedensis TaxID=259390 RepID=UPI0002FB0C59|nr:cupin [Nocardia takedensis]